eukprot:m.248592 g.248592  ORF g.248592 m.248592 type:complete len:65 (+) comp16134_c2_seq1:502-696(+)
MGSITCSCWDLSSHCLRFFDTGKNDYGLTTKCEWYNNVNATKCDKMRNGQGCDKGSEMIMSITL